MSLGERLAAAPAVELARQALSRRDGVWIVGGAVRDAALGRQVTDLDLAVSGDPATAAKEISRAGAGHAFELSAEFDTWRAVAADGAWQIDVTALRGETIEADLAGRDFTIGAVAVPLAGGEPLDPHGGLADLERRLLRVVGERSFAEDPLRLLRAARLAAGLALEIDADTAALARAEARRAAEPAGERQLVELRQLVGGADPLRGMALLDDLGLTGAVLPELEALRGVEQGPNHHLDVHGHTIAVLERTLEVEADLERFGGERAAELQALLAEPLADEVNRGTALRFGALFHDLGKPETRGEHAGYVTFIGHDRAGATVIEGICGRLRTSRALSAHLQGLALHHLRLGFLVHQRPLPCRTVYEYLSATEPVAADVTLLTAADRLAARGEGPLASEEMIGSHLELVRKILPEAIAWNRRPPQPPLSGDELTAELGLEPGPRMGEILEALRAAAFCGEAADRDSAIALARSLAEQ